MKVCGRPFGYVVLLALIGASIGRSFATVHRNAERGAQRRAAAIQEAERAVWYVLVGCILGAAAGVLAEKPLRRTTRTEFVLLFGFALIGMLFTGRLRIPWQ